MKRLIALVLAALLVAVGFVLPGAGVVSAATVTWYEQFTTLETAASGVFSGFWLSQTFTPSTSHYFDIASFCLYKVGSPTYTVTISLYQAGSDDKPLMGTTLCGTTFQASSLTTTATWYTYQFSTGCQLSAGSKYALVLSANAGALGSLVCARVNRAGTYSGGMRGTSVNLGTTWTTNSAYDIVFKEGGRPTYAVVTVTAPSAISFGTFHMGWNLAGSTIPGKVTVVPGVSGLTTWTVTAQASSPYLGNASDNMTNCLFIGPNDSLEPWTDWRIANGSAGTVDGHSYDGPLTYSGTTTPGSIPFYAAQFIESSDLTKGTYTTVITFIATCLP